MSDKEEIGIALIVKATEASTLVRASLSEIQRELTSHDKDFRTVSSNNSAKLDNLDRSLGELRLIIEKAETNRSEEFKRIFELLSEERKDRRRAVEEQVESSKNDDVRAVFKQLLLEERGSRKEEVRREYLRSEDNRYLIKGVAKAAWDKGGSTIILALCIILAMYLQRCSGYEFMVPLPK